MKDRINRVFLYIRGLSPEKLLILVTLIIIAAAIPFTVYLSQREQSIKQHAAELPDIKNTPRVGVSDEIMEKNYNRIKNRKTLLGTDLGAKNKLLARFNGLRKENEDLVIFDNENVKLIYIDVTPEFFNAEIKTTDVSLAKKQLEDWFTQQGFSQDAICNGIGLEYYLSQEVKDTLPEGSTYDPNPLVCP